MEQKRSRGRPKSFNPNPEQTTVQALDRAIVILKVLAGGEGMSLTELAEASGQAPATVYRVLSTLAAHGIVEVQPATQLWFVGQEAFRIGSAFLGRTNLVEQARVVMRELMADTGETANLAIADGGQVVFLSQVETHEPIRAFFRPGTRGPIHASGIGKALLAYLPEAAVERIVREQGLPAFTARTITEHGAAGRGDGRGAGAGLGGGRRGADRGDALHRRADLQRVPRGGGGGVDLRAGGADGPRAGPRLRRAGAGGGRPDHRGDRGDGAVRGGPLAEVAVVLLAEARGADAVEGERVRAEGGDALGDAGGDADAVAGGDAGGLAGDLDEAVAGEDDVALDGAGDGVEAGGDAGGDAREGEGDLGRGGVVEELGDGAALVGVEGGRDRAGQQPAGKRGGEGVGHRASGYRRAAGRAGIVARIASPGGSLDPRPDRHRTRSSSPWTRRTG